MLFGVFFTGVVVSLAVSLFERPAWTLPSLIGIGMGAFSFISNSSLYKGFAVGKASLVAFLTALPPALVVLFAYLLWGETLNGWQWAAFIALFAGVVMIRYSNDLSLRNLQGAQWGLLAMLCFAITDTLSKQSTLAGADPLPTMFFMFSTGSALFGVSWLLSRRHAAAVGGTVRKGSVGPTRSAGSGTGASGWSDGKTFLWGMTVGLTNAVGMIFILKAFALGKAGLVSAIGAMNILLILAYSRFFLKIPLSKLELGGIAVAVAGIALLRVAG
jgi:drug/metabolite transporter (DMT)-like permease